MLAFVVGNDNFQGGSLAISLLVADGKKVRPIQSFAAAGKASSLPFRPVFEPPLLAGRVSSEGTWFRGVLRPQRQEPFCLLLAVRRSAAPLQIGAFRVPIMIGAEQPVTRLEIPTTPCPYRSLAQVYVSGTFAVPGNVVEARDWLERRMGLDAHHLQFDGTFPPWLSIRTVRQAAVAPQVSRTMTSVDEEGKSIPVVTQVRKRRLEL